VTLRDVLRSKPDMSDKRDSLSDPKLGKVVVWDSHKPMLLQVLTCLLPAEFFYEG